MPFPALNASDILGLYPSVSQWPFPNLDPSENITIPDDTAFTDGSPSLDENAQSKDHRTHTDHSIDMSWLRDAGEQSCTDLDKTPLLAESYKAGAPDNHSSLTIPQQLSNLPTALSDFFIREVIPLYCAWDSQSNLMRVVAESSWQSSKVLYHTMQSMSAACLTSVFPELSTAAIQERLIALQCLDEDEPNTSEYIEARLLATVLLCHTASWHDPGNLAKERYHLTQRRVLEWSSASGTQSKSMVKFFQTAVDYWGMLLSFFTDVSGNPDSDTLIGPSEASNESMLHPFVGKAGETVKTLTDVGNLVSQYRSRASSIRFITEDDMNFFKSKIREARCLEKRLLAYTPADTSKIQDTGDPRTTLAHLAKIDEAYRCVGLLQIYRVFSDLLAERYNPWDANHIYSARLPAKIPSKAEKDYWLTSLALYTLELLRDIPFESRSRCIQPLILVAISSELRRMPQDVTSLDAANEESRYMGQSIIELAQARNFVKSRFSAYADVLPLRKASNILELVTSIWSALDEGEADVYWLDICTREQLNTLIG
ncbi:C6 zinc finger domain-containing protein [Fusarium napiforme]|uniref:C6 zinc finger domain-containing protein n=1 Tax=Fusarium napiforme TaxID=42672 RepID=A0A8H5JTT1_9HYPO|nr:C6 zinc finger domain-containing protein [Fusarium napiforme]